MRKREYNMENREVWYACYGSNINKDRFMNYINRCSDNTPPVEDRPYEFAHPVFFAGQSRTWSYKGTAFLDDEAEGSALGRIYKITEEQYQDVSWMEGKRYRKKIEFDSLDGIPVVSFTCSQREDRAVPSLDYFNKIVEGLKETYPAFRESALAENLINGIWNEDEIKVLDCLREAEHGLTNSAIVEAAQISEEAERKAISSLVKLGVVRQDRRSRGLQVNDDSAVFYTERDERPLIDRIRALKSEADAMRDVPADDLLTTPVVNAAEGRRIQYLTSRYERVPANRQAAIRIHGTVCQVCGFDFYQHYGELGKNYIEVHHIKPLSSLDEEVIIDPYNDLVCLCANCHRMMHRNSGHVMTVEELKRAYRE